MDSFVQISAAEIKSSITNLFPIVFETRFFAYLRRRLTLTHKNMKETIAKMNEVIAVLQAELAKANEGNKAAAARARKATLELEKLGKAFRKESIAEMK